MKSISGENNFAFNGLYLFVFTQFRVQGYGKTAEPNRCALLLELPWSDQKAKPCL
ncbi:hypothetical protein [Mesorhizobium sp. B2-8-5]|uniref:hypothetical protein n=1 Tax=Mesorhizobium sp. B2-8-5 TaxID=2589903 RepID=UPI0015E29FF3|nr:hypothetical protein [Mesorhizobium sp. B2-8-5]UCI27479.1 hypothetical protein FJ430_07735 [Mesorhizobium sp. B2-8-5]